MIVDRIWGIWGSHYDIGQVHLLSTLGGLETNCLGGRGLDCCLVWGLLLSGAFTTLSFYKP